MRSSAVNLTGVFNTGRVTLPSMIENGKGGSIILTSSIGGLTGAPSDVAGMLGYTAAKHGVIGLMRSWANFAAKHYIRVNSVAPTTVRTPMANMGDLSPILEHVPELVNSLTNAIPVEAVDPEDVAGAVAWLASDDARYITGTVIPVDAGQLQPPLTTRLLPSVRRGARPPQDGRARPCEGPQRHETRAVRVHRPASVGEAAEMLAALGDEVKVLAGGQSLVPMLSMRLAVFNHLIDIGRMDDLKGIERRDGALWVGAGTTEAAVGNSAEAAGAAPLLAAATPFVGHLQIRNRGTVGGSIAHADPAAEYPAVALALDAEMEAVSHRGPRVIPVADFFTGLWSTTLESDELLVGIRLPVWTGRSGFAVREIARRTAFRDRRRRRGCRARR